MKILVTGGAGFIGSHVVDAYLEKNHEVVVLDCLKNANPNMPPKGVPLIQEDLTVCDLKPIFAEHKFDIVNHHAAHINVRTSLIDPTMDAMNNIIATIRLMQAAVNADHNVHKFIFSSTGGAIYGSQNTYPTPENAPPKPESPYGLAKATVEQYIRFFQRNFGLKAAILRYSNVYGPRQDPLGEAGVVAIFAGLLLNNEIPTIYGDGAQTRDFVYVKDVARANLAVLHDDIEGTFNIGTATETSVNGLADEIKSIMKSDVQFKYGSPVLGELERSCVDISRAAKMLDWSPMIGLKSGLAETIAYFRNNRV